ncbi:MAG: acyl carrier protein [Bradymonadia bacterium]
MSARETVAQILGVAAESLSAEDSMLNHPRWDSQAHVEIMAWLNAAHQVPFTEESMLKYSTFRAITALVDDEASAPA